MLWQSDRGGDVALVLPPSVITTCGPRCWAIARISAAPADGGREQTRSAFCGGIAGTDAVDDAQPQRLVEGGLAAADADHLTDDAGLQARRTSCRSADAEDDDLAEPKH